MDAFIKTIDLDFKSWDVNHCTVTDFSIQMKISDEMWKNYLKINTIENPVDLKSHLVSVLEPKVQELKCVHKDNKDD